MAIAIEAMLRRAGLFEGMDERAADAVLSRIAVQTYEPGAFLVTEGEIGDAAFVLLEGSLQVVAAQPDGSFVALARLSPGALFGEQALLGHTRGRRTATVIAIGPVTVARVGAAEFEEALPPEHPLRARLVRLGEEQIRARLALQSSVFRALRLAEPGDTSGLGATIAAFDGGQALFYQGEPSDSVFVLVSGVAAVYVERGGQQQLVRRVESGQCVGERGLLDRAPRLETVLAEEPVTAFRIPAAQFLELHRSSPDLREYLEHLRSVYELPRRGFVTQFAGRFRDRECITSVYHLAGGRRAVASHVPREDLTHLLVGDEPALESATAYRFSDPERGIERTLTVSPDGVLLSLDVRGEWAELPELFVLALDSGRLEAWQCASFAETGSVALESAPTFDAEEEIVCRCLQVRRREVRRAILGGAATVEAIREGCRAGGACGACRPRLQEMLGKSAWTLARVVSEAPLTPDIRAFRLAPLRGAVRPARPGQHVVLQVQIDGRWIERPYTLSAPTSEGYYEITMKRLPGGAFSSWFFDRRTPDALIRVSDPQGAFTLPEGDAPVVFLVAGIGVTPALAACRALAAAPRPRRVHIDYSATRRDACACAGEIAVAPARVEGLTTRVRFTAEEGRLGLDGVRELALAHPGAVYMLCGPASYLASMREHLRAADVPPDRVLSEEFVSAVEGVPPASVQFSLRSVGAPPSLRLSAPPSGRASFPPWPPSSRKGATPPAPPSRDLRPEHLRPPPPAAPGGVCPVAHGTHREDGIGFLPPIVAPSAAVSLPGSTGVPGGSGTSGHAVSGSPVSGSVAGGRPGVAEEARAYLAQFYREKGAPSAFAARWAQVSAEIERTGTYVQTYDELSFGAKLAWRNSTRCIGRLFWNGLKVRDMRHLTTEEEVLAALVEHIELATNGGNLRAMMTVFAPAGPDGAGPRIHNGQLLRYAGYRQPDGSVLGDPMNVALTDEALRLGWSVTPRTRFDLLPLIVAFPGRAPRWMEIPRRVVREVPITHPEYGFFVELGLRWYALPAVSDVLFDVGGVKYTAAPFNGWYMATEIGARNFSDPDRYNLLPEIAERLGLDTRRPATLWQDRAQIELTRAVIHSFDRAGVKLSDHHAAAQDFLLFVDAERAAERCVHMRWSWITPPIAGSATPVFFLDQDRFPDVSLKPNFFYQPRAF